MVGRVGQGRLLKIRNNLGLSTLSSELEEVIELKCA